MWTIACPAMEDTLLTSSFQANKAVMQNMRRCARSSRRCRLHPATRLGSISVRTCCAVDAVEGHAQAVGDGSAAVTVCGPTCISMLRQRRAVRTDFMIDQPVCSSTRRPTARAANTMVRWASMESRLRSRIPRSPVSRRAGGEVGDVVPQGGTADLTAAEGEHRAGDGA